MGKSKHRFAFTLAEVLITLSIIGVVAALTIPSLISKNQEKETVVRVKKAYNVFSNAYNLAKSQYGEVESWGWSTLTLEGSKNAFDKISPFLNITKRCDGTSGCFPIVKYNSYSGAGWSDLYWVPTYSKGILADGTLFYIRSESPDCTKIIGNLANVCGFIEVDIDGFKGPHTIAKDLFMFLVTKDEILPSGSAKDGLLTGCKEHGQGCTAWVILKENLNYPATGLDWGDL